MLNTIDTTKGLQEQMEEFLDNNFKYFMENSEKRQCKAGGGCYYSPAKAGALESEGCAVGRWMEEENQQKADILGENLDYLLESYPVLFPEWMLKFPIPFLEDVQSWHDAYNMSTDSKPATARYHEIRDGIPSYLANA